MELEKTITYSNEDLNVVWKPTLCIHSKYCWKELPEVFQPTKRPWVNMKAASSEKIMEQVSKCPSGALSLKTTSQNPVTEQVPATPIIEVSPNGPLLIHGNIIIQETNGNKAEHTTTALCRCGHSANKPYCDGMHAKKGFVD